MSLHNNIIKIIKEELDKKSHYRFDIVEVLGSDMHILLYTHHLFMVQIEISGADIIIMYSSPMGTYTYSKIIEYTIQLIDNDVIENVVNSAIVTCYKALDQFAAYKLAEYKLANDHTSPFNGL